MSETKVSELSVLPCVKDLGEAMDRLDTVAYRSEDSGAEEAANRVTYAWGAAGLGAEEVSARDIELLARLHHRLSAQIGRLVRGPVLTASSESQGSAGPLVDYDSPRQDLAVDDGSGKDSGRRSGTDSNSNSESDSDPGSVDHARPEVPFGAQAALVSAAWSPGRARAVIAASRFAERFPVLERFWRSGEISTEMLVEISRTGRTLTDDQCELFVSILSEHFPGLTHRQVRRLAELVREMVQPDSTDDEDDNAHRDRKLVFSNFGGSVLFEGRLPKLEGQIFMDAIKALAETLRPEGDDLSQAQRNADALTHLLVQRAKDGQLPKLGGLPVSVSLTMTPEQVIEAMRGRKDPDASTDAQSLSPMCDSGRLTPRGMDLGTDCPAPPSFPDGTLAAWAVARMALCSGEIFPVGVREATSATGDRSLADDSITARLMARLGLAPRLPLAVGRAQRLATPAQRRALAVRDAGCVIPGCDVPPNQTQPHHVIDYSLGGSTDLDNLASLCFVHHRQVELGHWTLLPSTSMGNPTELRFDHEIARSPGWARDPDTGRVDGHERAGRRGGRRGGRGSPVQKGGRESARRPLPEDAYWVARPCATARRRR